MRRFLLAAAGLAVAAAIMAQETETVLKVDVDLVSVLFSVRDKRNGLVANLTRDDLTVFEDGKQQTIKDFVRESDLPLTIGLLVDVSKSQESLIEVEKQAAARFFEKVLRPKDMAFLISFGAEAELLQDSTNSAALLRKGLEGLRLSTSLAGIHPGPVPTISGQKGTILYDAVYLAASEKLRGEVGRKVIVVITDGVDVGSRYDLRQAIEIAQKADAIIYGICYSDPRYAGWGSGGDLKRMAEETGGRVFRVDRKHTLDEIFAQLQEEVRSQYMLTYTPTHSARDNTFRRIEIKPLRKDLKVQARKGYYATAASN